MRTSTKVTIGLSVAAIASISVAVIASEKVIKKVKHVSNRCHAKRFIADKFNGNEKLLAVVDRMSDDDLDSVMDIAGKVKEGRKHVEDSSSSVKETAEELKARLAGYFTK